MIAVAAAIAVSVAAGVALERRFGIRAQRGARALLTAILFMVLPPVTFLNVARLPFDADVLGGIGLAYVALAVTGVLAWAVARRGLRLRPEAVAYDSLVGGPALWVAGFGVGAAFGTRAGEGARERMRSFVLRNPPLAAALAGLVAPDVLAPDALVEASRSVIVWILPFGFLALGAILTAEAEEDPERHGSAPRAVIAATVLRLVVAPAVLLGLAAPLIDLPAPYLLLAAMPCGINSLAVAHVYGLDVRISAAVIASTTSLVVGAGLIIAAVL